MTEEEGIRWATFHNVWIPSRRWNLFEFEVRDRVVTYKDLWIRFECPNCGHEQDWINLHDADEEEFTPSAVVSSTWMFSCEGCSLYSEVTIRPNGEGGYDVGNIQAIGIWR
jgi:transcription elongation factor Elf1